MCCGNTRNNISTSKPVCVKKPATDVEKERVKKLKDCDKR